MRPSTFQHDEKKKFQIKISQDGEFAMTFDAENLRIKIYRNTDFRQFTYSKYSNKNPNNIPDSDIIDEVIVNFVISNDLNIIKIYNDPRYEEPQDNHENNRNESNESNQYRWSFDISSLQICDGNKYIFVAISYIDLENDMKVYDLAEMKLETAAKIVKNKDRRMKKYDNKNDFTISKNKLQLCYTRGFHSIKLYLVENGLQIAAKNFEDKIEKINLLEFINNDETLLIIGNDKEKNPKAITWDLFNTGKVDSISLKDLGICCLARTSGNVLHVDNKGKVRSILNIIEKRKPRKDIGTEGKIRTITEDKLEEYDKHFEQSIVDGKVPWVKNSCKPYPFCLYDNEEGTHFKEPIVCGKEPWVMDSYKTYSFCLYDNEGETIELIVGRSTVQIWHQIRPNSGFNEDDCPNKGNPFLEYIWTNGVPLDQEYDTQFDTRLHIKKIDYGCKYFNLEVYWEEKGLTKPKSRTIQWNDIVEKVNAVRSAYIAIYIYYVMIIVKTVFPFILFFMIVIVAFAHTMFILLKNREIIEFKASTFSGNVTNNVTHENINIKIKSEFDDKDNPFSEFLTSIEAAYFWTAGNWVQRDMFDFWAVDLFSIIASVLFVTILQNMFIALMSGVYERAANKGRQALLRFRARQIADYEALHHIHIWPREPDPKYIYYIGKSKNFEEWSNKREQCVIYKDFEEKSTYIKHNFQETDYDGNSIWKYNKSNTKKNVITDNT
ncbi:hypothetical protein RhiirA5_404490 [Rhizophagus irregularis]|uniref:Ion transport domain-containing protein n=1 Tax=Rhizophagus irregularis TaxID=588596 RepID=A0A2N0NNR9_9GLOM|nr:hypothetical protein RhiirA5_404490 [Rhizophagus irregularis]